MAQAQSTYSQVRLLLRFVRFVECSLASELIQLVFAVSGEPYETALEHVVKEEMWKVTCVQCMPWICCLLDFIIFIWIGLLLLCMHS